jgi:hypothetical protein
MTSASSRGSVTVELEGKGTVVLRPSDHIATGGEGAIYRAGDMVVKIYLHPEEMKKRGTPDKVRGMAAKLAHPYIVTPLGMALSEKGEVVGHYLQYVEGPPEGQPLPLLFTNDFRKAEGFTDALASTLIDRMRQVVVYAHGNDALLIDPNELNWFALHIRKDPEPRIIDVDSWVLGPMPPTVSIMPSIRDWHVKHFGKESDWFSWAVVTFQIYTGIHPYKGTLAGYARADLEKRMRDNASVFAPGVRLNMAVRDFSCIPGPLRNWYEATFQKGERVAPPSPFDTGITAPPAAKVMRATVTGTKGTLIMEKIFGNLPHEPVIRTFSCGVAVTKMDSLVDLKTKKTFATLQLPGEVTKLPQGWLIGQILNSGETEFRFVSEGDLKCQYLDLRLKARQLISYENRMFAVCENGLTEIKVNIFGTKVLASAGQSWGIIANSTKWYNGVGVLDAMGAKFVIAPFGEKAVAQVRVRELDKVRVVNGKSGNRFVSLVVLDKKGEYHKLDLLFSSDYQTYTVRDSLVDGPELNLAILPKGVCAEIEKDGEMTVFVPSNSNTIRAEDSTITTDMTLSNWGDKVIFIRDGEVWSVRMK